MSPKVKEDIYIRISLTELNKMKLTSSELATVSKLIEWVEPLENDEDLIEDFKKIKKLKIKLERLIGNVKR
tara:strand:+ start:359 stop:571 length:213 start_codon:yes stop_codon:yes gene_type:complete